MNKLVIGIAVVLFLALAGGSLFVLIKGKDNLAGTAILNDSGVQIVKVNACDILTQQIAEELLGKNLVHPTSKGNGSTINEYVTSCDYATKITGTNKDLSSGGITLLVRSATSQEGIVENQQAFTSFPTTIKEVKGLGNPAFYSATFNQLNVLKGGNWYIVSGYSGLLKSSSLDDLKKVAEKLHFR